MLAFVPLVVLSLFASQCWSLPTNDLFVESRDPQPRPKKVVVAHFMVGNTYPYKLEDWTRDIKLAASKGIDAFALNVGRDSWQPDRVRDAYEAARRLASGQGTRRSDIMPRDSADDTDGFPLQTAYPTSVNQSSTVENGFANNDFANTTQSNNTADVGFTNNAASTGGVDFKLFISWDMSSLPCGSYGDGDALRGYVKTYAHHPQQLNYPHPGAVFVSTFSGSDCTFGQGNTQNGWNSVVRNVGGIEVHFVPAFFSDVNSAGGWGDGAFSWNGGWPMGNDDVNFQSDQQFLNALGGKTFMTSVSPWFFTHYGPNSYNKNWIYRGDDWLFSSRWQQLIYNSQRVDIVQVISWNDYGESHYIGPIEGAQPMSESWTTGFDHQGWLDVVAYFASAFKNGAYPPIQRDRAFVWGRVFPAGGYSSDSVGKPDRWQFMQDYAWALVLLPYTSTVTLSCGSSTNTTTLPNGASTIKVPLRNDCQVGVRIARSGQTMLDWQQTGYNFRTQYGNVYNFNAYVAASP